MRRHAPLADAARRTGARSGAYERIWDVVRQIPTGRVATYGQVAAIEGASTARQAGYAMAALPAGSDVPWHRVINGAGRISERSGGGGTSRQRERLQAEGVVFDARGRVDFDRHGWDGPDWDWLERHGCEPAPRPANRGRRGPAPVS